ncbi:MAG: sugar transporter [Merismopedia sp. SIO2A8]|nr:sugar transporter [Merismopedia sp. SIO2A8]
MFDAPEYSGEHQLFTDGTVSLPFVGSLRLQGLTLTQAETLIANRLSRILRRPFTTIRLLEARPISLAVTGEVYSPGAYTFSLEETNGVPTVTKAIQLAQGIRLTADIRNIQIQRRNPLTNQVDERFEVDLWALLSEGDLSQDVILEDGDSIVIPQATNLNYEEVNVLAYANISPEQMTVNVVGEVEAPGAVQVKPNTPLHQALLAAGGFTNRARKKEVILIRLNPDGTVTQREIDVDFAQAIDSEGNPPLRPFDTIVVGRSNFAKVTDALDRALSSVARVIGVLSIFGL